MASSLLSMLRVTGGVLVSISIIWLVFDFNYSQLGKIGLLLSVGCVAVAECVVIERWLNHAKSHWLRAET